MPDTQNEEFDFIKEKIKNKPINKKRLVRQAVKAAGLGVIFGVSACVAFTLLRPVLEEKFYEQEKPVYTIPKDTFDTETEQQPQETEQQEPEEPDTQIVQVPRDLEVKDYQKLQNKLYAIGIQANSSIVTVTGVKSDMDWFNTPYETEGQTCGIVIAKSTDEILIMTEQKIIQDANAITVTFRNGSVVSAQLKKYDGNTGIAILSVPLEALDEVMVDSVLPVELGNSYQVSQGDVVIAVGSPLGSNYSILTGNITATNNSVSTLDASFTIFTTDIVGSTNGSGVLLNLRGQVVGLIMQDYGSKGEENTLTALSISEFKEIIELLSNDQNIGYLGLKVSTVTSDIEKEYELPRGVYIKYVEMDSPALAAGLQNGDVIVSLDDNKIVTVEQYQQYIRKLPAGTTLKIGIMRQGNEGYTELTCTAEIGTL